MLRGQNSSFPQESVSPNTLRYTWQINERLTITNTQAVALGEGSTGPDLWPQQAGLEPPALGSPAAPGGWQPSRGSTWHVAACFHGPSCCWASRAAWLLLLTITAAISSFSSLFLMIAATVLPVSTSTSLFLPCWLSQRGASFVYFLNPVLLSHASLKHFLRLLFLVALCLPPHLPHCLPLLQHQQSWQLLPKLAQKRHLAGTQWTQGVDQVCHY